MTPLRRYGWMVVAGLSAAAAAFADCLVVEVTLVPGVHVPGGVVPADVTLRCPPGGGSCGPCEVNLVLGPGCESVLNTLTVGEMPPSSYWKIASELQLPLAVEPGCYTLCGLPHCRQCPLPCGGCDDACPCSAIAVRVVAIEGDVDGDGSAGVGDLLALLAAWGACDDCACGGCPADLDADCEVGISDLLVLLASWGEHE